MASLSAIRAANARKLEQLLAAGASQDEIVREARRLSSLADLRRANEAYAKTLVGQVLHWSGERTGPRAVPIPRRGRPSGSGRWSSVETFAREYADACAALADTTGCEPTQPEVAFALSVEPRTLRRWLRKAESTN